LKISKTSQNIRFYIGFINLFLSCQSIVPSCHLPEFGEDAGNGTITPGEEVGTTSGTIDIPLRMSKILKILGFI
jgi:hypothetical protein